MIQKLIVLGGCLLCSVNSLANLDIASFSQPHVEREMIISFEEGVPRKEKELILAQNGATLVKEFKSSNAVLARIQEGQQPLIQSATDLSESLAIKSIGLNRIFSINNVPQDPNYSRQYQYDLIDAEDAWDITTGSSDIVVGIIDTGIVYDHPDLAANIWRNPGESGLDANGDDKSTNGIDDDGNGYIDDFRGWDFAEDDNDPMDDHGHGTHCAGSIGAQANNQEGIVGLNWNIRMVPLRFITAKGLGTEADAIEAIEYATMMGFHMTSNSWGGDARGNPDQDTLYNAIKAAADADILFIAAAGNASTNTDVYPTLPASFDLDNIISVAASDSSDRLASFSNFGASTVDILAPGAGIHSTIKRSWYGSAYGSMSGTSMAAPIVAGAAALVKSAFPEESAIEIKNRILEGADQIAAGKGKVATEGRLNVYNALTL